MIVSCRLSCLGHLSFDFPTSISLCLCRVNYSYR